MGQSGESLIPFPHTGLCPQVFELGGLQVELGHIVGLCYVSKEGPPHAGRPGMGRGGQAGARK